MGVPTSEVGYTPTMPRREDHEVHKGHVVALDQKKKKSYVHCVVRRTKKNRVYFIYIIAVSTCLHSLCLLRLSTCELIFTVNLLKNIRRF